MKIELAKSILRDRLSWLDQANQFMNPQTILTHFEDGHLWAELPSDKADVGVPAAYQSSLAVRELRIARDEVPRGFKIGFTNRNIWSRYNVYAPISRGNAGSASLGCRCPNWKLSFSSCSRVN